MVVIHGDGRTVGVIVVIPMIVDGVRVVVVSLLLDRFKQDVSSKSKRIRRMMEVLGVVGVSVINGKRHD